MKKKKSLGTSSSKKGGYVGVRFAGSPDKIYHYEVRDISKVHLGQELVVHNEYGAKIVFVVLINPPNAITYARQTITEKVTDL